MTPPALFRAITWRSDNERGTFESGNPLPHLDPSTERNLIESDLFCGFRHINILSKDTVCYMLLLLHRRAEFQQLVRDQLIGSFEDINQATKLVNKKTVIAKKNLRSRVCFIMFGKQSDGQSILTRSSSSTNSVDIVFYLQWELLIQSYY